MGSSRDAALLDGVDEAQKPVPFYAAVKPHLLQPENRTNDDHLVTTTKLASRLYFRPARIVSRRSGSDCPHLADGYLDTLCRPEFFLWRRRPAVTGRRQSLQAISQARSTDHQHRRQDQLRQLSKSG